MSILHNVVYKYRDEFVYESSPDVGDDNVKNEHLVFWNGEFIGSLPTSPYRVATHKEFVEWVQEWLQKKDTERW